MLLTVDPRRLDGVLLDPSVRPPDVSGSLSSAAIKDPPESVLGLLASVREAAGEARLIVVSNRESVIHETGEGGLVTIRPASGLVTAVEPIVVATHGTWVAHGSGSGDRRAVDAHDRVGVPAEQPSYTLRRVWLTPEEEEGYYNGLSNEALWPLCHIAYTRPTFRRSDWQAYRAVNEKFCAAVLEEAGSEPAIVFIHDYHLALLPRLLKERRSDLTVVHFWHIPWPNREAFRIFPWAEELLDGLLGSDLLGFHIQYHCNNFLNTVDRAVEARVDYEHFQVLRGGAVTRVRPFPISIDYQKIDRDARKSELPGRVQQRVMERTEPAGVRQLVVSVDRIDYTKGIPERLLAMDRMLESHPELRGRVSFLNLCAPSRTRLPNYRELNERIDGLVAGINERYGDKSWTPVMFLRSNHDYETVLAAYRRADVLVVSSLHDGMNLVAKEFVAARSDGLGAVVLSSYTGAARELDGALLVNPYDVDGLADQLFLALTMPTDEQRDRMARMRKIVSEHDVYHWGTEIFSEVGSILQGTPA